MHESWVTVQEYETITGRKHQSVYRSIKRGTIESKRSDDGVLLVLLPATDETDVQPGATDGAGDIQPNATDSATVATDDAQLYETDATEVIQPDETDAQTPVMPLTVTYSQEYVDMLKSQIDGLKADKAFLQQALAASLMLNGKSTDVQPDVQPNETEANATNATDETNEANEANATEVASDPADAAAPAPATVGFIDRLKFLFTGKL